jgi:hypothetical protein
MCRGRFGACDRRNSVLEAKADRRLGAALTRHRSQCAARAAVVRRAPAGARQAPGARHESEEFLRLAFNCVVGVGEANCPPDTRILGTLGERNRFGKAMRAPTLARRS